MASRFDPNKNTHNISKHGVSFEDAGRLEWDSAITKRDTRVNYVDERFITYAMAKYDTSVFAKRM